MSRKYTWLRKTTHPGVQARPGLTCRVLPSKRTRHPCLRCPSPWPWLAPASDWLTSRGKEGSQSSLTYSQRLADWSAWVNPNLRGILAGGGGWVVCCTGSNSTDQLVSITHVLMCCNAWRDHLVKPFKPSRHSPLQLGGYLLLFFVCNKLQSSWSVRAWEALSHYHHFTNTQWCI